MAKKTKEPTARELAETIRERFRRWDKILKKGTTDPFWPDGTNLNLVRNHIFYYQGKLKELCKRDRIRACPKESRLRPPRRVSETYMAPKSRAAKYYSGPWKLKRRRRR